MAPPPGPHTQHVLKLVCYLQKLAKKRKKKGIKLDLAGGSVRGDMEVLAIMS